MTVLLTPFNDPNIGSLNFLAFRLTWCHNIKLCMSYVLVHSPSNIPCEMHDISASPTVHWTRAYGSYAKRCLSAGVYGGFNEIPDRGAKEKFTPMIVNFFLLYCTFQFKS